MAIQKTPPLGWPHTEAEQHLARETREILETGEQRGHGRAKPKSQPPPGQKTGCGCAGGFITLLIVIALLGVAAAILVPRLTSATAQEVFSELHPTWEIETSDQPNGSDGPVRLVTWDYDRAIGRLVMMDPIDSDPGWEERPLINGDAGAFEEGRLLDAFADAYAQVSWSYLREAEPLGGPTDGSEEVWRVYYRIWPQDGDQDWTDLLTTTATRIPATGEWLVVGPDVREIEPSTEESAVAE